MGKKILCLDIGDGVSSAATVTGNGTEDAPYGVQQLQLRNMQQWEWTQLYLTMEQMKMLSVYLQNTGENWNAPGLHEELEKLGSIRFGQISDRDWKKLKDGELFTHFKGAPACFSEAAGSDKAVKMGITCGILMACYANELVKVARLQNQNLLAGAEELQLYVGCPASEAWTSECAREAYASLIRNAVGAEQVCVIPESRGALFRFLQDAHYRTLQQCGVAVSDFGGSTADITVIQNGRAVLEFSWGLGGHYVEMLMLKQVYRQMSNAGFQTSLQPAAILEKLRWHKEAFFNGNSVTASFPSASDAAEFQIRVDETFMQQALRENIQIACGLASRTGTWPDLCQALFQELQNRTANSSCFVTGRDGEQVQQPCSFSAVILTGGACKMGFIEERCRDVFPNIEIIKEENPVCTVSNGLAWAAISDQKFQSCLEAAAAEVNPEEKTKVLLEKLSECCMQALQEVTECCLKEWLDSDEEKSMNDLNDAISRMCGQCDQTETADEIPEDSRTVPSPEMLEKLKKDYSSVVNAWSAELVRNIEESVSRQAEILLAGSLTDGFVLPNTVRQLLQDETMPWNHPEQWMPDGETVTSLEPGDSAAGWSMCVWGPLAALNLLLLIPAAAVTMIFAVGYDKDTKMGKLHRRSCARSIRKRLRERDQQAEILYKFKTQLAEKMEDLPMRIENTVREALEIAALRRIAADPAAEEVQ